MGVYPRICRIPLVPRGKIPLVVSWQTLPPDDPILQDTWNRYPTSNTGLRLDGLLVADCDSPERVTWWEEHAPYTPFQSRGNPAHLSFWYRANESVRPMRLRALDIKTGPGHFMVVPPSIHPGGWPYRWMGPEVDEATLGDLPPAPPTEFFAELTRERAVVLGNDAAAVILEHEGRNNLLASVGGLLRRRGFGHDFIYAFLMGSNQAVCEPPLSAIDVERIAMSVCRYDSEVDLTMADGTHLTHRRSRYGKV